jgi:nitrogen regulatory protein PII
MKLVIAVIQPTKLSAVREALEKIEVTRMTVCDGQAFVGKKETEHLVLHQAASSANPSDSKASSGQAGTRAEQGREEVFRGRESGTALLRKIVLEIVVNDDFLDRTVETIVRAARTGPTGTVGDGNVFVLPAEQATEIDTAFRGPGAV